MLSASAQLRKVEAEINRLKACERQIAELERENRARATAIADAKVQLLVELATERGLLALPPAEMAAAIARMEIPAGHPGLAPEADPKRLVDRADSETGELVLGAHQSANVTVQYTSYKRGERVELLQGLGFRRGGQNGFWQGQVDRENLLRLIQAFPNKVQVDRIDTIHPEPTTSATAASQEGGIAPEQGSPAQAKYIGEEPLVAEDTDPTKATPPELGAPNISAQGTGGSALHDTNSPERTHPMFRVPFSSLPRRVPATAGAEDNDKCS